MRTAVDLAYARWLRQPRQDAKVPVKRFLDQRIEDLGLRIADAMKKDAAKSATPQS